MKKEKQNLETLVEKAHNFLKGQLDKIYNKTPLEIWYSIKKENPDIKFIVEKDKSKDNELYRIVEDTFNKYKHYIKSSLTLLNKAAKTVSLTSDAYLWGLSYMILGNVVAGAAYIDAKALYGLLDLPDKIYGVWYGLTSGNILDALKSIGMYIASFIPGASIFNKSTSDLVYKKIKSESLYKIKRVLKDYETSYEPTSKSHKNIIIPTEKINEIYKNKPQDTYEKKAA